MEMALGARFTWLHACSAMSTSDLGLENELGGAEGAEADAVEVRDHTLFEPEHGPALPLGVVIFGLVTPNLQNHLRLLQSQTRRQHNERSRKRD
jgi:hypothetical protein